MICVAGGARWAGQIGKVVFFQRLGREGIKRFETGWGRQVTMASQLTCELVLIQRATPAMKHATFILSFTNFELPFIVE